MDESAEQTRRLQERMSLLRTERGLKLRQGAEALAHRHWNAQRLLEPLPVVIPFADRLTIPSAWLRARRDYARFLNLIEVSAFRHEHQREVRDGIIVASLADYATTYGLAAQVLAETLSDVKKPPLRHRPRAGAAEARFRILRLRTLLALSTEETARLSVPIRLVPPVVPTGPNVEPA